MRENSTLNVYIAKKAYIDNVTHALAKIRPYDGPTDFLKGKSLLCNKRILTLSIERNGSNRAMSIDLKRQSLSSNLSTGRTNRSSMRGNFENCL